MNIPKVALTHLSKDKKLKEVIDNIELSFSRPNTGDVYFDLLRSIAGQQLSVKAAKTIFGRFIDLFLEAYPYPDKVLSLTLEDLRGVGFSRQKSGYIQNVATFFKENQLEQKDWTELSNEDIIDYLTQIKGVGKWTVEMILMFTVQRLDVLPLDDLGIQQAMIRLYGLEGKGKVLKAKMLEIAKPWQPYRTVASFYLWRYKDNLPQQ